MRLTEGKSETREILGSIKETIALIKKEVYCRVFSLSSRDSQ